MWTSTLNLDPKRVFLTKLLARFWRNACFTSFAPLSVQNLPRQSLPANNWVRVRNRLAGICGSDLHLIQGDGDFRIAPAALPKHTLSYPGHEVVGEVIEVGEDVRHLHIGDRVALQHGPNCVTSGVQQLCSSCAAGYYNLCEKGMLPGPQPLGGGWSEEMLLHEDQLFRIAPDLSDEQAVLLEPTAVALHAILRRLPKPGDQVLIIGASTIGLLTLQVVRALVPDAKVSVLARHSFQVEQATRMDANHIIYTQDSYASIQRVTGAQHYRGMFGNRVLMGGYDVIYDTVGSSSTLHHALRWVRAHGAVVLVGLQLALMNLDLTPVWFQEIDLLGSLSHGLELWPPNTLEQRSTFSVAQQLIQQGKLHPEQLITHRFAINNYRDALLAAMHKSQSRAVKVLFDYSLVPATVVPNVRASARKPRTATIDRRVQPARPREQDTGGVLTQVEAQPVLTNALEEEMPATPISSQPLPVQPEPEIVHQEPVAAQSSPVDEDLLYGDDATVIVNMHDVRAALQAAIPSPQEEDAPLPEHASISRSLSYHPADDEQEATPTPESVEEAQPEEPGEQPEEVVEQPEEQPEETIAQQEEVVEQPEEKQEEEVVEQPEEKQEEVVEQPEEKPEEKQEEEVVEQPEEKQEEVVEQSEEQQEEVVEQSETSVEVEPPFIDEDATVIVSSQPSVEDASEDTSTKVPAEQVDEQAEATNGTAQALKSVGKTANGRTQSSRARSRKKSR